LKIAHVNVEENTYPYFYYGAVLITLATVTAVLPYMPTLARKTAKPLQIKKPKIITLKQ